MVLSQLPIGEKGKVENLKAQFKQRRRLLDLGLIPGTIVEARRKSPSGDPVAYLIKGTIIALRKEETDLIDVSY